MMEALYADLETIPCQDAAMRESLRADADEALVEELAAVKAPGNYKDADKIAAYVEDTRAKMLKEHDAKVEADWLKTSFDGGLGSICVIGYALGDREPVAITARHDVLGDEAAALREFFGMLQALGAGARLTWVGHNLVGFDLPFLWKRAMVLGVKPPMHLPRNPKPWADNVFDTMVQWDPQLRAGGSMERLCRILGIPGKGEISGKDVWPLVQAGRLADVANYCKGDIERTRAIHRRMVFAQPVLEAA
jgi:3'-5' exonuclease